MVSVGAAESAGWRRRALPPRTCGTRLGRQRGRWWTRSARCARWLGAGAQAHAHARLGLPSCLSALSAPLRRLAADLAIRSPSISFLPPPLRGSLRRPRASPAQPHPSLRAALALASSPLVSLVFRLPPVPVHRQVEVWEGLAPQLELRTLVLLACTHRDLRAILSEDSIWRASLRACVDVAHDLSVNAGEALTWRYVALQVLEGLVRLKHPAAQVRVRLPRPWRKRRGASRLPAADARSRNAFHSAGRGGARGAHAERG